MKLGKFKERKVFSYSLNCVKKKEEEKKEVDLPILSLYQLFFLPSLVFGSRRVLLLHLVYNANNPMTSFTVQCSVLHLPSR